MRIDFSKVSIKTPEGEIMKENVNGELTPVNIIKLLITALRVPEEKASQDEQTKDFLTICKFIGKEKSEVELTSEEITRIKQKISKITDAWIFGQVSYILEGKYEEIKF
jgi:hypothetical protein